jgi:predicted DNA-binding transcriptional regulator
MRQHLPHIALDDEYLNQLETHINSGLEPLIHFEKAFVYIRNTAFPILGALQAVLLVDESELILRQPWAPELHSNLRALLSNRPLVQEHLGIQMAGSSSFYAKITEEGSPLRNILLKRLLPPLSEQECQALACEPTKDSLNAEVVAEIMRQADGHPFLLQYILHYLWAAGIEHSSVEKVQEIVERFSNERDDFEDWCEAIGAIGERIYALLVERNDWVKRSEIFEQMHEKPGELKKTLETLIYHGLLRQDNRYGYRCAGAMFCTWFAETRVPYLHREAEKPRMAETRLTQDIDEDVQHLQALLRKQRGALRELEWQKAQFGLRVPLDLINDINRVHVEIEKLEERLADIAPSN